ncbi:hypothetical protein V6O07_12600, partial [Arthrospira platensis SPKY2]
FYMDLLGNCYEQENRYMTYGEAMEAVYAGLVVACLDNQLLPAKLVYKLKGKNSIVSHRSLIVNNYDNGVIEPYSQNCNDMEALWQEITPDLYVSYRDYDRM